MDITDENLIAQKVAIWEGIWAAKQTVTASELVFSIPFLLEAVVGLLQVGMGVNCNSVPCWDFVRYGHRLQSVISPPGNTCHWK